MFLRVTSILGVLLGSLIGVSGERADSREGVPRRHSESLILGDSVFSLISRSQEAIEILEGKSSVVFAAQPCQRLLTVGCVKATPSSALEIYQLHRHRITRDVVVATGYNDIGLNDFESALEEFCSLANKMGHRLIWVTYAERSSVRGKAERFNRSLRSFSDRHRGFQLADWNSLIRDRDELFAPDGVHLSLRGSVLGARLIREALDRPKKGGCVPRLSVGESSRPQPLDRRAVGTKWAGHQIGQVNFIRPSRSMSQIGG